MPPVQLKHDANQVSVRRPHTCTKAAQHLSPFHPRHFDVAEKSSVFRDSLISGRSPSLQNQLTIHPAQCEWLMVIRERMDRDVTFGERRLDKTFPVFLPATRQESIAHAGLGFQPARCRGIITKFLAQFTQHDAQVMRVLHMRPAPDLAQ
jgi:hypothetical protein